MQEKEFKCSRNGLTVSGTEYRCSDAVLPAAIVSHGFMANRATVKHYAMALAEAGYAAFCFDFCGGCVMGGKSDGKTTDMTVLTEVSDLQAVMGHVLSLENVAKDGLLLMGCSQGGFVSAMLAAKDSRVSDLVLFYPALCIPDDARKGKMMFARFDPQNVPEIINCGVMKLGKQYALSVIKMNPYDEIKGFTGRVLIVHGDRDDIVDISYSEKAYEAYKETAPNPRFEVIKGGRHGFSKKKDKEAIPILLDFVNQGLHGS
jgi:hypothetical protein